MFPSRTHLRILAQVDRPNTHSIRIARELGMKQVGEAVNPETGGLMDVFSIEKR